MPELPEVETVCRGMAVMLEGQRIGAVAVRRPDLRMPFPLNLAQRLEGRRIDSVTRRAKYIFVTLDDGHILVMHLGMSGRVRLLTATDEAPLEKHDHFVVDMKNGARMVFNDPRRFGMVFLLPRDNIATDKALGALGPEPLDAKFTGKILAAALSGRKADIKAALLDQRVVAGLGNIYVSEALFHAGIDPRRQAGTVTGGEATRLCAAIKKVLRAAIAAGGSTLRDYRHTDGNLGYFQHNFSVYDRAGRACPGCTCQVSRTGGVQKIVQAGRSTFFCPRKQG